MDRVFADFNAPKGIVKPLHAVNNGNASHPAYISAQIPYTRNHDASICYGYGGEHCMDVHAIFPNFDADETDPASYDFDLTDDYVASFQNIGTEVFYRLGTSVEVSYEGDGIYAAAAKDENGNSALMLTVYGFEKDLGRKEIALSLSGGADAYEIFLLDENHDNVSVGIWHPGETVSAENMSVILLKSL